MVSLFATGRPQNAGADSLSVAVDGVQVFYDGNVLSGTQGAPVWASVVSSAWVAAATTATLVLSNSDSCGVFCTTFVDRVSVQEVALAPAPPSPPVVLVPDGDFAVCGSGIATGSYANFPRSGCPWTSNTSSHAYVIASRSSAWGGDASADGSTYFLGLQSTADVSNTLTALTPGATCAFVRGAVRLWWRGLPLTHLPAFSQTW